jgi:phospholipase/carboxylesterase
MGARRQVRRGSVVPPDETKEGHQVEPLAALLDPLLRTLEMLAFVARHLHPPDFESLMASVGTPDEDLKSARSKQPRWPDHLSGVAAALDDAAAAVVEAFAGLREVLDGSGDLRRAYRALRLATKGMELLYPLASVLPPVNRFFLDPALRSDAALLRELSGDPRRENTGIMRFDANGAERGGFWLYVPENYTPDRAWPLVMALHGGSGTGRLFLWSWLRETRGRGAILAAPTSVGGTWALMGEDPDTPNLARILEAIRAGWQIDSARLMLTGMSDGGTFTYVSGLQAECPFTHLAPVSAAFHPLLAEMADAERVRGLPVHVTHGALDWMFPVALARQAQRTLTRIGASVSYCELDDLSHAYPREMNVQMLNWLDAVPARRTSGE